MTMSAPSKSVLEVITATTDYFKKHGIESPRLNTEHLVAHVLQKKRLDLYMEFDRPLFEKELAPLRELVKQRAQGKPLQHLIGNWDFYGRIFKCDGRGLVPRPETEQLVEFVLEDAKKRGASLKILDVGTGSGVIALTLAAELPDATVEAVDLSDDALALARENATALSLETRVQFSKSDLLEQAGRDYDIIVANLPYIAAEAIPGLAREVQHDPKMALDGGPAGLDFIDRLLASAKSRLKPGALVALEIGHDQADAVAALFEREKYQDIRRKSDYQGVSRFSFANHG